MISKELMKRYKIRDVNFYVQLEGSEAAGTAAMYRSFLIQTDYIPNKIIEAQALGTPLDQDYTEILQARAYAREQISFMDSKKE